MYFTISTARRDTQLSYTGPLVEPSRVQMVCLPADFVDMTKLKAVSFSKIRIQFPAYAVKEVFLFEGTDQNFGKQHDSHSNSTFMSNTLPTKFGFSLDMHKKY